MSYIKNKSIIYLTSIYISIYFTGNDISIMDQTIDIIWLYPHNVYEYFTTGISFLSTQIKFTSITIQYWNILEDYLMNQLKIGDHNLI